MEKFSRSNELENTPINNEISKAPDGWKTNKFLSKELGAGRETTNEIANQYRESNPEYFKKFKVERGRIFEHYSPELIKIISEEVSKVDKVPDGWKTKTSFSKELGVFHKTINKIANQYRESNPEYFREFKVEGGQIKEHYSPELIKIISEEVSKVDKVPDGWKTNWSLSKELDVGQETINKIVNQYRENNPEYFKKFKVERGRIFEHYSPEFIEIIKKEINKFDRDPEGWKTNWSLSNELDVASRTINEIANQYQDSNPEYFKKFKVEGGQIHEHYSPEFIEIIKKEINKFDRAPDDWITNKFLSKELGVSEGTIKKTADKFRKNNPEYFKKFKIEGGQIKEHYSPELIKIISEEVKKAEKVLGGWTTNKFLSKELDVGQETINKIVNQYRENNPEYFKKFKVERGRIFEHYSPELIEIISEEVKKVEKTPDGWKTRGFLSKELGVEKTTIKNIGDRYRESNPEYFREFKIESGPVREHYSPELIEIIKKELESKNKNILESPENWQSVGDISERTGISKEEVEKIAKRLREKYQGQFGKFKDRKDEEFIK